MPDPDTCDDWCWNCPDKWTCCESDYDYEDEGDDGDWDG